MQRRAQNSQRHTIVSTFHAHAGSLILATNQRYGVASHALFWKQFGNKPLPDYYTLPLFLKQQSRMNPLEELYVPQLFSHIKSCLKNRMGLGMRLRIFHSFLAYIM